MPATIKPEGYEFAEDAVEGPLQQEGQIASWPNWLRSFGSPWLLAEAVRRNALQSRQCARLVLRDHMSDGPVVGAFGCAAEQRGIRELTMQRDPPRSGSLSHLRLTGSATGPATRRSCRAATAIAIAR